MIVDFAEVLNFNWLYLKTQPIYLWNYGRRTNRSLSLSNQLRAIVINLESAASVFDSVLHVGSCMKTTLGLKSPCSGG
jgi:hypothetical protein